MSRQVARGGRAFQKKGQDRQGPGGVEDMFQEGQAVHVVGEQGLQRCEKDLVQKMPLEMEERVGPSC